MIAESDDHPVARGIAWLRGALVTWALSVVYFAIVLAVCFPVVVGSVAGAFVLWERLALDGVAGMVYFVAIGAMIMVEFTVLKKLMDGVGSLVLRPGR